MAKYKQKSAEQRKAEIDQLTEDRNKQVESFFTTPEQMKEYLSFKSKFYDYSVRNTILIKNQFNGAEAVGSFNFWKGKGFSVQKGEKGIKILVPTVYKTFQRNKGNTTVITPLKYASDKEKEDIKKGLISVKDNLSYTQGSVFDISQTNATEKDLPHIFPNKWLDGEVKDYKLLYKSLEQYADNINVPITEPFEELGVSKGAYIKYKKIVDGEMVDAEGVLLNPRNSELQNIKTLIHELSHAKLHPFGTEKTNKLTKNEKEFQAEMTAYTVCSYFNIDTSDYSLQYIHHYAKEHEKINDRMALLEEVKTTSHDLINHIEKDLLSEKNIIGEKIIVPEIEIEKSLNNKEQQLQDRFGDLQVIIGTDIKKISELPLNQFKSIFQDEQKRNILGYEQFKNISNEEVIKSFNALEESSSVENIKLLDKELTVPYAFVRSSEAEINKNLMTLREMDKQLLYANLKSFTEDTPYSKVNISVVVPVENDTYKIKELKRIDLGDGEYENLKKHLDDSREPFVQVLKLKEAHFEEPYTKKLMVEKIVEVNYKNLHLKENNNDDFNLSISNSKVKGVEEFALKNDLLTTDEINNIKQDVKIAYSLNKDSAKVNNDMVNLEKTYDVYKKLEQRENTGELTDEKVISRLMAENEYKETAFKTLGNKDITKNDIEKMESKDSKNDQSIKINEKENPFEPNISRQKNKGMSI